MKLGNLEITYKSSGRFSCTLKSLVSWLRTWGWYVYLCIALGSFCGLNASQHWQFWAVAFPTVALVQLKPANASSTGQEART